MQEVGKYFTAKKNSEFSCKIDSTVQLPTEFLYNIITLADIVLRKAPNKVHRSTGGGGGATGDS
jgi:hypothetical protein